MIVTFPANAAARIFGARTEGPPSGGLAPLVAQIQRLTAALQDESQVAHRVSAPRGI